MMKHINKIHNCYTAELFYKTILLQLWQKYQSKYFNKVNNSHEEMIKNFPFHQYHLQFSNIKLFINCTTEAAIQLKAKNYFQQQFTDLYHQIQQLKPLEILKTNQQKHMYLINQYINIITYDINDLYKSQAIPEAENDQSASKDHQSASKDHQAASKDNQAASKDNHDQSFSYILRHNIQPPNTFIITQAEYILKNDLILLFLKLKEKYPKFKLKRLIIVGNSYQSIFTHASRYHDHQIYLQTKLYQSILCSSIDYIKHNKKSSLFNVHADDLFIQPVELQHPLLANLSQYLITLSSSSSSLTQQQPVDLSLSLNQSNIMNNSLANKGMNYIYQCINVSNSYETLPINHIYQNIQEAEYMIQLYIYLCIMGYKSSKIIILSLYSGQVALLKDIAHHKLKNSSFQIPKHIYTLQQYIQSNISNDILLISLVRTSLLNEIQYINLKNQLITLINQARLGLYIFMKIDHYIHHYHISPILSLLNINELILVPHEKDCKKITRTAYQQVPAVIIQNAYQLAELNMKLLDQK